MATEYIMCKAISEALESLLREQSFGDVTVSAICKTAGISRPTFYRYYRDKYDLATWSVNRIIDQALAADRNKSELLALQDIMIQHLYGNRTFLLKILEYKGQNSLRDVLYQRARELFLKALEGGDPDEQPSELDLYAIEYACSGTVAVMLEWMKSGCSVDPDKMSSLISHCLPQIPVPTEL